MEESSDAHMETDVSSTTEDVPEAQEVTGSNGDVEMIVIVEKVVEDGDSNPQCDSQPPMSAERSLARNPSPPMAPVTISPCTTPVMLTDKLMKTYSSGRQKATGPTQTQSVSEHIVDSSSKIDVETVKTTEKIIKPLDKNHVSPVKPIQQDLEIQNSTAIPPKLSLSSETLQESPIKETSKQSPIKEKLKPSPIKEVPKQSLIKEIPKHSLIEETHNQCPIKETPTQSINQETPKQNPIKETPKPSPVKESLNPSPTMETSKPSPIMETNPSPIKDTSKPNTIKDTTKKSPVKEIVIPSQVKETSNPDSVLETVKLTPVKKASIKAAEEKSEEKESTHEISSVNEKDVESKSENICEKNADCSDVMRKDAPIISQSETPCDTEKEHNKSISRELKSLIKSAKESKIISECTQLTSKTRKSRTPLDATNTSLNTSVEAAKLNARRSSDNSQKSNCSEKSEKVAVKRSMRSQNPEFVNKVKLFLNSVTSRVQKESDDGTDEEAEETKSKYTKKEVDPNSSSLPKKKIVVEEIVQDNSGKLRTDPYCWRCHWAVEHVPNEKTHAPMTCTVCPRSLHFKCLSGVERSKISTEKSWVCPECITVLHAESSETRSPAMKKTTLNTLCILLKYAINRLMDLNGVEPFLHPVDRTVFPDYEKYVVHPMDLTLMKQNIDASRYGSTEAFLADVQWILHNSIIFNTCEQAFVQSKLTAAARVLIRSCRAEMGEIEACPECYAAAHAHKPTWFTDVCTTPHILLWAKLKGFPYWPAKGMSVNSSGLVDVRFFGAHDRAWVPAKDCFLYSEKDPNNFRTKRQDIWESMQEAEQHIRNISRKYGKFVYPPFKTQFDYAKHDEQLKLMIPSFEGDASPPLKDKPVIASPNVKNKSRSNSKSSKSSHNDGDTSECEEPGGLRSRKMADGAVIARMEDESVTEKDSTMEVDSPAPLHKEGSRKRRRSEMEEAVITIIDSSSKEKKKRVDGDAKMAVLTKNESPKTNEMEADEAPNSGRKKSKEIKQTSEKEKRKESPKLGPIKIVISTKSIKSASVPKTSTPKTKEDRVTPIKFKQIKLNNSFEIIKSKNKSKRRRSSKSTKSSDSNSSANTSRSEKKNDKKHEKKSETVPTSVENNSKDNDSVTKSKENGDKSVSEKSLLKPEFAKSAKERIKFDDDTSLAVLARGATVTNDGVGMMPTISSVRSLSTTAHNTNTTSTKTTANNRTLEVSIEHNLNSSIVTLSPSGNINVRNIKDSGNKQQKPDQSLVGKVGVRSFARMTSLDNKTNSPNKDVHIEIKAEPIDVDDCDRQSEKMDLMNAFKLRPIVPPTLRDVRINKAVVTSLNAKKTPPKPAEVRPRARKTFPQPKKDDGRSELNGKNSMVYIPIQPPTTPGPAVRGTKLSPVSISNGPVSVTRTVIISTANNIVNTVTNSAIPANQPSLGKSKSTPTTSTPTPVSSAKQTSTIIQVSSAGQLSTANASTGQISGPMSNISQRNVTALCTLGGSNVGPIPGLVSSVGPITNLGGSSVGPLSTLGPSVGQVPTTVHTVPLITSVNGQWTFSLQPIMSVGAGLDDDSLPIVNGLTDRLNPPGNVVPIVQTPVVASSSSIIMPSITQAPGLTSISSNSTTPTTITSVFGINRTVDSTVTPAEMPRLQQRPAIPNPLDPQLAAASLPTPSSAGPITAKINQNAVKLADYFRTLLEDSLEKIDEPQTLVTSLKLQLEHSRWRHRQELEELKHNHELVLSEVRSAFEKDKSRALTEARVAAQADLEAAVKLAKTKQWCANCNQEAQFYCCWNTSYCDYPCQRAHWNTHYAVCTQQRQDGDNSGDMSSPPESRLQPQPDNVSRCLPTTPAPALTVGGKIAQLREAHKPASIIMSMEKDTSGNSKIKCVGTYSKGPPPNQSIVINKQVPNNEDSPKKVTPGGYLIVGASGPANAQRRNQSIHYFS